MKNKSEPLWTKEDYDKNLLILLHGAHGFSGYYVDRFNDVYSVRRPETPLTIWGNKFPSGVVVARLTLFDDGGKRRQPSRQKILKDTLGKEEFERRENLRENKVEILKKEDDAWAIESKRLDMENDALFKKQCAVYDEEMRKDALNAPVFTGLDEIRKQFPNAFKRKEELGGMF